MVKLFSKESLYIHKLHILFALGYFITLWIIVAYMVLGGNILFVVFLHLLGVILLVLGGFSVPSVYSHIGSNRELLSLIAYEPLYILVAAGFYLYYGTFDIETIRNSETGVFSLILLFAVYIFTMFIQLKKSPFDSVEAHQEIVGGVEVEYVGAFYEILYTAKWLEYIFVYLFLFLFFGSSFFMGLIAALSVFLLMILIDNTTARLDISYMVKYGLLYGISLSVINILGVVYEIF
jgi:ech hydrogenase subunit B